MLARGKALRLGGLTLVQRQSIGPSYVWFCRRKGPPCSGFVVGNACHVWSCYTRRLVVASLIRVDAFLLGGPNGVIVLFNLNLRLGFGTPAAIEERSPSSALSDGAANASVSLRLVEPHKHFFLSWSSQTRDCKKGFPLTPNRVSPATDLLKG